MIGEVPIWAWWIGVSCLILFTGGLLKIISWFLGRYIDDNKESWSEIKRDMSKMTRGINNLVVITTSHHERLDSHNKRLDHHDEEIIEFRRKL